MATASSGSWTWVWLKGKLVRMDRRELWHSNGLMKQIMRANIKHMLNNGGEYVIRH